MKDVELWAEILLRDIQNGLYFDALGDVEQVKFYLAEALKSAIVQYGERTGTINA